MLKKIALLGNSNCGKTTLFNNLTKAKEYVGNRNGVTVDISKRRIKNTNYLLYDLPGIYSLSSLSEDEKTANRFLKNEKPDGIINIIDGTNPERNLYLTIELIMLNIPIIIAVNMADEMEKNNIYMDILKLSSELGVKCIKISAKNGQGLSELISALEGISVPKGLIKTKFQKYYKSFESEFEDVKAANAIYKIAEDIVNISVTKPVRIKKSLEALDKIILNKYMAIPVFICIMAVIFILTFGSTGSYLKRGAERIFDFLIISPLSLIITKLNINGFISSLILDGALKSVGTVISFIPQIILLFVFISILEDTGYMARAAFILDKLFSRIGLSGKAFIPFVLGFGCTTPAVMSARAIGNSRERRLAVLLTPYMSCSAKLPIYMFFADIFFKGNEIYVILLMYLTGISVAVVLGKLLKGKPDKLPFILELPRYRLPSFKNTLRLIEAKTKDFLLRAGTVIFLMSVAVWLLTHLSLNFKFVYDTDSSILSSLGKAIAPFFKPLGFGSWQAALALLSGVIAKETVVASLNTLSSGADVKAYMLSIFTKASALSYMTFCLLYTPCISAVATIRRELKNKRWVILSHLLHIITAYVTSFIVYTLSKLFIYS